MSLPIEIQIAAPETRSWPSAPSLLLVVGAFRGDRSTSLVSALAGPGVGGRRRRIAALGPMGMIFHGGFVADAGLRLRQGRHLSDERRGYPFG